MTPLSFVGGLAPNWHVPLTGSTTSSFFCHSSESNQEPHCHCYLRNYHSSLLAMPDSSSGRLAAHRPMLLPTAVWTLPPNADSFHCMPPRSSLPRPRSWRPSHRPRLSQGTLTGALKIPALITEPMRELHHHPAWRPGERRKGIRLRFRAARQFFAAVAVFGSACLLRSQGLWEDFSWDPYSYICSIFRIFVRLTIALLEKRRLTKRLMIIVPCHVVIQKDPI